MGTHHYTALKPLSTLQTTNKSGYAVLQLEGNTNHLDGSTAGLAFPPSSSCLLLFLCKHRFQLCCAVLLCLLLLLCQLSTQSVQATPENQPQGSNYGNDVVQAIQLTVGQETQGEVITHYVWVWHLLHACCFSHI